MVSRFDKFSYDISEIYYCWHRIAAQCMEEYGLKGAYSVYFTALCNYPDGITAARLSQLCNRNKADVSRSMAQLEEMGLIKRNGNKNGYRALIALTDKGRDVAKQITEKAERAVAIGGMGINDEERAVFYRALDTIAENLRKYVDGNNADNEY